MSDFNQPKDRDRWIPRGIVLFFVALAGLQLWFVTVATSTFSGLVTDQAYATGLNYNEILDLRRNEQKLGWRTELAFQQEGGLAGQLELTVRDRGGAAFAPDEIRATAERMSRHPQIQTVAFRPSAEGPSLARLEVPLAGRWFLRLRIARGDEVIHEIHEVDVAP